MSKSKYVLLKGVRGNIFWTMNEGSMEGYTVLHEGDTVDDMVDKWKKYHPNIMQGILADKRIQNEGE